MFRRYRTAAAVTVLCLLTVFLYSAQAQITELRVAYSTWSLDGRFIALINSNRLSDTIEVFTPELIPVVTLHIDRLLPDVTGFDVADIAWSNDSTALAAIFSVASPTSLPQAILGVWNTATWTLRFTAPYRASDLSWSPSGDYLGAGAFIVDARTGALVSQLDTFDPSEVRFVNWNPTNERQYLMAYGTYFQLFDPFTVEQLVQSPHSGASSPEFNLDGQYLAFVNRNTNPVFVVDIIDTTTFQIINSIQPGGVLGEPYALNWLTNDQLWLMMSDQPFSIVDPFDGTVLDTLSFSSYTWDPQGRQALSRPLLPNGQGRFLAVVDRETEAITSQFSLVPTVRTLAITDTSGIVHSTLLAGEGVINDVSAADITNALIQAFTYPEPVGSVVFDVDGARTIDNTAPYTLPIPPVGTYTISAVPYSEPDAQGEAGLAFTVTVQVVGAEPNATPTPLPTDTPTSTFTPAPTLNPTATLTPTPPPTPAVTCTATAATSAALVNAITAANANGSSPDTICLTANATYTFTTAQNAIALPSVTTPITIVGNGAIVERGSGAAQFRAFNVTASGSLTLQNMTIRNFNAGGGNGSAVQNAGTLSLNGVTLTGNAARFAGGIHNTGTLTITNSTFTSNTSQEDAGAIYLNSGTLTVSNSTFQSNSARYGAAIYAFDGTVTLTNTTFRMNSATEQGAGVFQRRGTMTVTGGLFDANSARFGSGIYVRGALSVSGTAFTNNIAVEEGAAIYNENGNQSAATVAGSTFTGNRARFGGAIYNRARLNVTSSTFTTNTATESGGAVYHQNGNSQNGIAQTCFSGNTARFGGAVFSQTGNFNAQNNWWGAAAGPTGVMVNNQVVTSPFLTACPN